MGLLIVGLGVHFLAYPEMCWEQFRRSHGVKPEAFEVNTTMEQGLVLTSYLLVGCGAVILILAAFYRG